MAQLILLLLTLLLQEIQIGFGFTFLVPAHLGGLGQNPESHKMVVANGDGSNTAKVIKKVILPTIISPKCQR